MELDLKKVFYIIVCLVLVAIIGTAMATPIKNKINEQKTKIENTTFSYNYDSELSI